MIGRRLLVRCVALVVVLGLVGVAPLARAQEATPVAGSVAAPPSRDEYKRQLRDAFPFEEPQQRGGLVIYGAFGDIVTVNGMLASDAGTFTITGFLFEYLNAWSVIDGRLVPGLADSWELADDKVTYTFHLNKDAKWHDGVDLTAEDVKFSYDALLDPSTGSSYTSTAVAEIDSYRVIDPDTFELKAKEPLVTFLYDVTTPIMPKHIWESVPFANWASDPGSTGQDASRVVGTGPFKFKEWVQGDHLTIVRNDDYWDDVPVIDEFIWKILPDPNADVEALKAGEIDILDPIIAPRVEEIQNTEGLEVAIYDTLNWVGLMLNLDPAKTPLFQDREVRQALMYALDRDAINQSIFFGFGTVADGGPHGPLSIAYAPDQMTTKYTYDPEKAKQLLAQAGWTDSNGDGTVDKNGVELTIKMLLTEPLGATGEQVVSYLQQALGAVGVGLEIETVGDQEWFDRATVTHDFELVYWGFNWDVTGNQGALFRCDAYENGFNIMKYCNPAYDPLDDQQLREFDPVKRKEMLVQLADMVNEDLPIIPFRFYKNRVGYPSKLHNFFPVGLSTTWSLQYTWIEQE